MCLEIMWLRIAPWHLSHLSGLEKPAQAKLYFAGDLFFLYIYARFLLGSQCSLSIREHIKTIFHGHTFYSRKIILTVSSRSRQANNRLTVIAFTCFVVVNFYHHDLLQCVGKTENLCNPLMKLFT